MPLAGPLRAWIAKCKAYAAQHGCSYKEAMSALGGKGKKSHRHKSHRGGGVADSAQSLEGATNMGDSAAQAEGATPSPPPPPTTPGGPAPAHAGQTGGGGMASAFEVGAMSGMSGGRRRRRGSKHRGSKHRGSKRRGSRRNSRRRQSKRGGGSLSYSDF